MNVAIKKNKKNFSVIIVLAGLILSCSTTVQKNTSPGDATEKVDFNKDFAKIRSKLVSENCKDDGSSKCRTFLHYLAASGNLEVITKLELKKHAFNINAQDELGNTPLHYAFMNNQQDVAEFLIKNGADTNIKNVRGRTPIHLLVLFLPMDGYAIPSNPPASGGISSPFGIRKSPFGGEYEFHYALDIAAPINTEIRATAAGRVIQVGWNKGLGKMVKINHYNGFETIYAHCNTVVAEYYSKVKPGQKIALMGSTGNSTGSHCHYVVLYMGQPINPYSFIVNKQMRAALIARNNQLIDLAATFCFNANIQDSSGKTPLHYAVTKNLLLTKKLLEKKANINIMDYSGMTPLHFAASSSLEIAGFLLRSGAYVNSRTRIQIKYDSGRYLRSGTTPLGIAIRNESLAMAKLLSSYGGRE